jgi:hypothetical protein
MIKVKNGELYQVTRKQPKPKTERKQTGITEFPLIENTKLPKGFTARQVGEYVWLLDENSKLRACETTLQNALDKFYSK